MLNLTPDIYRAVLETLPIGVYLTDVKRQIVFWNAAAEKITGYLGQEVIGHFCHDNLLMHCDENQVVLCGSACPLAWTMHDGEPREARLFLRHKEGQRIAVWVRSVPIRDEFGMIIGAAEFFEARSHRTSAMSFTKRPADELIDPVTEVPDRRATLTILGEAIDRFALSPEPFGVLLIGLDDLEHVRHVYSCQATNEVLYAAAQTLAGGLRPEDLVGRWRDDRFVALVSCPTRDSLQSCAERLQRLISLASVPWWGDRLSFTVSMGGTMVLPGDTVEILVGRAEEALEAAAAAHAGSVVLV